MNNYITQDIAEREFDLLFGNSTYHAGACARDTPTQMHGKVERIVLGTIKIDLRTGKIVEDKERK